MNSHIAPSPLLADDGVDGLPTLGDGGHGITTTSSGIVAVDFDQSPLERLIAQSTSEQRGDLFRPHRDDGDDSDFFRQHNVDPNDEGVVISVRNVDDDDDDDNDTTNRPSLVTLIAGNLCLLQVGFVWASFLSSSWFDTHLMVTLALPLIKRDTDQLLHSTTLASLLSDLLGAEEHWAATFLIVTSLIVPCLSCVCGPAWTMGDHEATKDQVRQQYGGRRWHYRSPRRHDVTWMSPRLFLEWAMRLTLTVFFLLCVLDVGTSSIEIDSNNTRFVLNNQIQSGLACFVVGVTCSISIIMLLRMAKTSSIPPTGSNINEMGRPYRTRQNYPVMDSGTPFAASNRIDTTAPPNRAFQLPWNIRASNTGDDTFDIQEQSEHQELQTPLLGSSWDGEMTPPIDNATRHTPLRQLPIRRHMDAMQLETMPADVDVRFSMPFWKRAVIYELAAASTLLWLPALFLPLFELTYSGIVSDFMPEVSFSVQYWELPAVLWQRGIAAGTAKWVLAVLGIVLIFFVYVCPLLATLLAIATWRLDPTESAYCRNVLWTIQPCVCGIIFALSVQLAIPAFQAIGEFAIDNGSSGLCKKFEIVTSDTCMTIAGEPRVGLWFLWSQAFSLEAFMAFTLVWKHK